MNVPELSRDKIIQFARIIPEKNKTHKWNKSKYHEFFSSRSVFLLCDLCMFCSFQFISFMRISSSEFSSGVLMIQSWEAEYFVPLRFSPRDSYIIFASKFSVTRAKKKAMETVCRQERFLPVLNGELPARSNNHISKLLIIQSWYSVIVSPFFFNFKVTRSLARALAIATPEQRSKPRQLRARRIRGRRQTVKATEPRASRCSRRTMSAPTMNVALNVAPVTYCICRGPDDGNLMIMCEHPNCGIQWFHVACLHEKIDFNVE